MNHVQVVALQSNQTCYTTLVIISKCMYVILRVTAAWGYQLSGF
jgi:hypothetical protein